MTTWIGHKAEIVKWPPKIGGHFSNKVILSYQKMYFTKEVIQLIFFNENNIEKDSDVFDTEN